MVPLMYFRIKLSPQIMKLLCLWFFGFFYKEVRFDLRPLHVWININHFCLQEGFGTVTIFEVREEGVIGII